ncbi:helix-turn-helix domain-containing protein [Streptomyces canus]|uniref:helix-turn-helix domain-containing protein n=1 Tax=Streptomyces canus TaxID=58343 RepID=UPI0033B7D53B
MNFHGTEVRQKALTLLRGGTPNAEVARRLNVPLGTVGYWKHLDRAKRGECPGKHDPKCPRCDDRDLDDPAYSYLLGLYLGDGHISHYSEHRVPNLMITCTQSWPGLMNECEEAMRKKHERTITLEPWQQEIVDTHPWGFIRGLIHSDGCRITNWTTRLVAGERKRYEYPRYFFSNKSDDIRKLLTDTLDLVGVEWTTLARGSDPFNISIARKASVALMDTHVGPKH